MVLGGGAGSDERGTPVQESPSASASTLIMNSASSLLLGGAPRPPDVSPASSAPSALFSDSGGGPVWGQASSGGGGSAKGGESGGDPANSSPVGDVSYMSVREEAPAIRSPSIGALLLSPGAPPSAFLSPGEGDVSSFSVREEGPGGTPLAGIRRIYVGNRASSKSFRSLHFEPSLDALS